MKRIFFSLILASAALSASAMNVRDARDYAYFLTDKMAYELNLTPLQYERVYEVNLDYFLAINSPYDVERYQDYRDDDLRCILSNRQYWDYSNANYFYRPLTWGRGSWVFNIYSRYNYANNYYFGRPSCYDSYQGSNWALRISSRISPYSGISFDFRLGGMRDSYSRYYNVPINVQPYQHEPLIILDGRRGGNASYEIIDGRYGGYNGGYYVSPSSEYYGNGAMRYSSPQSNIEIYDGRRGGSSFNGVSSNYYRGYQGNGGAYYGYGRQSNSYYYSVPQNRQSERVNYGNSYDSGRRGNSAFQQPQRDIQQSQREVRSNSSVKQDNYNNSGSTREVNGTIIVGGRR